MRQMVYVYLMLIFAATLAAQSDAKRGCALYGHSCYGGHGKRSEVIDEAAQDKSILPPPIPLNDNNRQTLSYVVPPEPRDLDAYQRYRLARIMKLWMDNQRNSDKFIEPDNASSEFLKDNTLF